jgi:hypothetical protein
MMDAIENLERLRLDAPFSHLPPPLPTNCHEPISKSYPHLHPTTKSGTLSDAAAATTPPALPLQIIELVLLGLLDPPTPGIGGVSKAPMQHM